jgi:hypothetical protein
MGIGKDRWVIVFYDAIIGCPAVMSFFRLSKLFDLGLSPIWA